LAALSAVLQEMVMLCAPSDKPQILVVEDDLATREALSLILSADGYHVATAADGLDALGQLRVGERPGLILLDLMMPLMDGWQFRQEQLRDPRLADIPVIVCSAAGRVGQRAANLHALAYLDKPIDPMVLLDVVRRSYPSK
jgi:CheY-like chemotaxis protein